MEVAFIPPRALLKESAPFSNYHLILAPQVLDDPVYRSHYWQLGGFKVLDNGIAEGVELSQEDILQAAKMVGADEIVLPDVMGNSTATLEKLYDWTFYDQYKYMGVVQGDTIEECMDVIEAYRVVSPLITTLGLPRILGREISRDARLILTGEVMNRHPGRFHIHYLGAHEWVNEIQFANIAYVGSIRGFDTSMPFVHGYFKNLLVEDGPYYPRPDGYFDLQFDEEQLAYVGQNLHIMKGWAS